MPNPAYTGEKVLRVENGKYLSGGGGGGSTGPISASMVSYGVGTVKDALDILGTASQKDFTTSVASGSTDLVTSGAVYTYIDSAITQVLNTGF